MTDARAALLAAFILALTLSSIVSECHNQRAGTSTDQPARDTGAIR